MWVIGMGNHFRICFIARAISAALALASGSSQIALAQTYPESVGPVDARVFSHAEVAQPKDGRVRRFDSSSRTRGLAWGWGHSWSPFFGKTRSDLGFVAFHPQMGWFISDRIELYGEATLFIYHKPPGNITAGLGGLAGRAHFWNDRALTPYIVAGAGLLWTSLDVREIDRIFNFQHFGGVGLRWAPLRGPGLTIELRNHHISNAGTVGENLGVNAGTIVAGMQWILR
jgi:Lipid A 3-O-deacylase (PagL)